jgi:hypothetical protein
MVEATHLSETPVLTRPTRRHIPEDDNPRIDNFFLSSMLLGQWSASRLGRLTSRGNICRYALRRRLGGPQSRCGRHGEEPGASQDSIFDPSVVQLVASRCSDWAIVDSNEMIRLRVVIDKRNGVNSPAELRDCATCYQNRFTSKQMLLFSLSTGVSRIYALSLILMSVSTRLSAVYVEYRGAEAHFWILNAFTWAYFVLITCCDMPKFIFSSNTIRPVVLYTCQ